MLTDLEIHMMCIIYVSAYLKDAMLLRIPFPVWFSASISNNKYFAWDTGVELKIPPYVKVL